MAALNAMINEIETRDLKFLLTRIDASHFPDQHGNRENFLFTHILTKSARYPSGKPTSSFFLTTVNVPGYSEWIQEETRFYGQRYGKNSHLIGFDIGPFSEPFVSQRSSLLAFDSTTDSYEFAQYTPDMSRLWNKVSKTTDLSMPTSEKDPRFKKSPYAYFDFIGAADRWYFDLYQQSRKTWHAASGQSTVPFILQMSGYDAEKFILGRTDLLALNWMKWVSEADAIGISLYTHSEYPDFGHQSIRSMVSILRSLSKGKPCFVIEGGTEQPYPVFDEKELTFLAEQARDLQVKTFIYEFFKKSYEKEVVPNDGHLLIEDGQYRKKVLAGLKRVFTKVKAKTETQTYQLRVLMEPRAVREQPRVGEIYRSLINASAEIPIEWTVEDPGDKSNVPLWTSHILKKPRPTKVEQLINQAPLPTAANFEEWSSQLKRELQALTN